MADLHDFLRACIDENPIEAGRAFEEAVSEKVAIAYNNLLPLVAKDMQETAGAAETFFTPS